jgi:hypothetical protein
MSPNAPLTARAPWKGVGGGNLSRVLARPYVPDYYQGRERSSGLLDVAPVSLCVAIQQVADHLLIRNL